MNVNLKINFQNCPSEVRSETIFENHLCEFENENFNVAFAPCWLAKEMLSILLPVNYVTS